MLDHAGHALDPFQIGVRAKAVVEARALQAVAVGHFNGVHLGFVERLGDLLGVLYAVLVANGVAAIAQGHVGDVDFLVRIHGVVSPWLRRQRLRRPACGRPCVLQCADQRWS
ncbi:hypothetical protein SDC9_89257 [bioreactor metagenome]|uniref:Uncharacterized protein n=1 Tax=bioreactor metagenome TaxID=1076179 RepID=A0A644ZRS4_9ZZZZ